MQHQRSNSFLRDLQSLRPEYREGVSKALEAMLQAIGNAAGKPPTFPKWLKISKVVDMQDVWQVNWALPNGSGRATFQYVRIEQKPTVRWRRVGPLSVMEEMWAARQGQSGNTLLPSSAGMVAYTRTKRGELVYLEKTRWEEHIIPAHVTQPPIARGKRTTTWWPVLHTATGHQSMSHEDVIDVIMDAVREGDWQNAPRGTLLSVYDLPQEKADRFGVSEVKVSTAPDGRILSAYPALGTNVLAIREMNEDEMAVAAANVAASNATTVPGDTNEDDAPFRSRSPQTSFG